MLPVDEQFFNYVALGGYDGNCSHEPGVADCAWFHLGFVFLGKAEFWGDFWEAFGWAFPFDMRNCVLSIIRWILWIPPQTRIRRREILILPLALILLAVPQNFRLQIFEIFHIHLIVIDLHVLHVLCVMNLLDVFTHLF